MAVKRSGTAFACTPLGHLGFQDTPNKVMFGGRVRLPVISESVSEFLFQRGILFSNFGMLPQEITEAKIVAPLGSVVFNNMQMECPDIW
jgi:hypothetical protein